MEHLCDNETIFVKMPLRRKIKVLLLITEDLIEAERVESFRPNEWTVIILCESKIS